MRNFDETQYEFTGPDQGTFGSGDAHASGNASRCRRPRFTVRTGESGSPRVAASARGRRTGALSAAAQDEIGTPDRDRPIRVLDYPRHPRV